MDNQLTIKRITLQLSRKLDPLAGESAPFEARQLVMAVTGLNQEGLLLHHGELLSPEQEAALAQMAEQRLRGAPLQYIIGRWDFMGLTLKVDARALIPRQDTETLCEHALGLIRQRGYQTALDLCCGSGCIGTALGKLGGVKVDFADISPAALELARENAQSHGIGGRFFVSDLFAAVCGTYDLIACNPPYLTQADMDHLQRELLAEPANALYGGEDGLDFYRRIAGAYRGYLNPGGTLLLEVGSGQARAVEAMLPGAQRAIVRDVNNVERVVTAGI